jgi:ferredoxin-NADP reductase
MFLTTPLKEVPMAAARSGERWPAVGARTVTVEVLALRPAARDAITLQLALPGTQHAPAAYRPGQFITLAFTAKERTIYRSYSLCGDGRAGTPWEITVKRQDGGLISTYLCQRIRPGTQLQASMPQGSFTLPTPIYAGTALVFVAGGSGITPLYGMLLALARLAPEQRPRVWLHYAYRSPEDAIYGRELATLDPQDQWLTQQHYVSARGQRLRPEEVLAAPQGAEWYVCGPESLKRAVEVEAWGQGVPNTRLHAEVFASPHGTATPARAAATPARIRLSQSGAVLSAHPGETLLEALERHGYAPSFSCRAGACGTCRLRLLAGQVRGGDGAGLSPAEKASGYVLSCVAEPSGDVALGASALPRVSRPGGAAAPAARWPQRSRTARKSLHWSMAAASLGLFATAWGLASHAISSAASATASQSTSNSSTSGSASSSSNQSGSSSIQIPSGQSMTNTSTGVS